MKKLLLSAAVLGFTTFSLTAVAQDEKEIIKKSEKDKKASQEIIIRKKGDKDARITVEINGDRVTINGKPLSDFKDDNITINKRNITIMNRNGNKNFEMATDDFMNGMTFWNGDGKEESYAFLGVTTDEDENGAKISELTKESAAEKAGLKIGDIITKINDKKVNGPEQLSEVVRIFKPKEEVTVYYKRDGKDGQAKAILGERKEAAPFAYSFTAPEGFSRSFSAPYISRVPGMKTIPKIEAWGDNGPGNKFELYSDLLPRHQKLGLKIQDTEDGTGVKVLDVDKDSPAEKAGLKKDDILTEVAGKKVSNTDEARDQLQENKDKSNYNIKAKRNGMEMGFDIRIPKKLKTANL